MGKSLKIRTGDRALIIAGKNKGTSGKVLHVLPRENLLVIEGANMVTRHRKPRGQQDPGGIVKQEGHINASNVMVICPSCGKATRVGHKFVDGKKLRACKKCGQEL